MRVLAEAGMAYSQNVTYVAIADAAGRAPSSTARPRSRARCVPPAERISAVLAAGTLAQLRAIYSDRTFEVRETLLVEEGRRAAARVRVDPRRPVDAAGPREPARGDGADAVDAARRGPASRWRSRPRSRSGCCGRSTCCGAASRASGAASSASSSTCRAATSSRELGKSFNTLSAELSAARTSQADHPARLESVVDRLEDAVAIVSTTGRRAVRQPRHARDCSARAARARCCRRRTRCGRRSHRALQKRESEGPVSLSLPMRWRAARRLPGDGAPDLRPARAASSARMLMARNVAYLTQVQSTLRYSRKVAALSRLLAGVAHEVKNPLNAMTIHLELLKQKLRGRASAARRAAEAAGRRSRRPTPLRRSTCPGVMKHVGVISDEIKRLDNVVQGFLKFTPARGTGARARRTCARCATTWRA